MISDGADRALLQGYFVGTRPIHAKGTVEVFAVYAEVGVVSLALSQVSNAAGNQFVHSTDGAVEPGVVGTLPNDDAGVVAILLHNGEYLQQGVVCTSVNDDLRVAMPNVGRRYVVRADEARSIRLAKRVVLGLVLVE